MMYFQYGDTEINYLKRKDKKLAWTIEQIGHIERKLDANLFAAVVRRIKLSAASLSCSPWSI